MEDIARKSFYVSARHSPLCHRIVLLTTFATLQHCHRPYLLSQKEKSNQLPKIIRPATQSVNGSGRRDVHFFYIGLLLILYTIRTSLPETRWMWRFKRLMKGQL